MSDRRCRVSRQSLSNLHRRSLIDSNDSTKILSSIYIYRVRQQLGRKYNARKFLFKFLLSVLPGCTAAVVWPTGLRNFQKTFQQTSDRAIDALCIDLSRLSQCINEMRRHSWNWRSARARERYGVMAWPTRERKLNCKKFICGIISHLTSLMMRTHVNFQKKNIMQTYLSSCFTRITLHNREVIGHSANKIKQAIVYRVV